MSALSARGGENIDKKHPPLDADDEIDLWLLRNVVVASCPCNTTRADLLAFLFKVFLHVRISALEGDVALLGSSLREQVVSTALIALLRNHMVVNKE